MSSQDFLDYGWRIPYSEFVIGSSRFLYPIKITETPAFENPKRTGRSENPFFTY
jgi:hypothetical protein